MRQLIGSKEFYKKVMLMAFPIMVQNGISNFVNLLDNIMIGSVGTEQMSGVSIVNQLMFVFILCVFGAVSGAGILGAQYFGQKNNDGVRDVLRIKLILGLIVIVIASFLFFTFDKALISLYLHEGSETGDLNATLEYGRSYLRIMLLGVLPMAVEMSYSSTLRETGETKVPMQASVIAVFVNLILNYILIFGKLGAPQLGVAGAAIATVASRYIQMAFVLLWSYRHRTEKPFLGGVFQNFKVSGAMFSKVLLLALPIMMNETLWSAGTAAVNTCYSYRGLSVVAAINIQSTIYNIFNIMFIAMGDVIAIIAGQQLGAGQIREAKETSAKIIAMSVVFAALGGLFMLLISPFFPLAYNTTEEVRLLAGSLIRIIALFTPIHGFLHAVYFAIRSGGKTVITVLFDCVYLWVVAFPFAYILSHYTGLNIKLMFIACQAIDLVKVTVGVFIYRSGIWARNITGGKQ